MNKYILTVIILLFSTGILFAQDNVKAVILDDKIKDINITDEFGNKIELDIEHSNLVEIDNTKYQQGLFHTKYVKNTSIDSWYDDFLSSSSVSVYSAKNAIGKAAYEMESQSVSNAFEDVLNLGYKYDSKKDTQLSCSDSFIKGDMYLHNKQYYSSYISSTRIFPVRNLAMAKAQEVILKDIENKGLESSEDIFFLALAEYVSDGLNNLPYIQEKINQLIAGGVSVDDMALYLSKYDVCNDNINKCNGIALFMSKIPLFKENDVADAFEIIRDNGLIEYAAFLNGYFNIFNDNVYEIVQVSKVNEQAVLNIFEINPPDKMYENLYPRYYKLISDDKSSGDVLTYTPQHCTDNVYFGNLYIFPYNNVTYIINTTESENKIVKIQVRSPKFFNTQYGPNYNIEKLIRNANNDAQAIKKKIVLHQVSTMNTFSYVDNDILKKEYKKQVQSPLGDVDKLKDRRGEKISVENAANKLGITIFNKADLEKSVDTFISYLQKYSSQTLLKDTLGFYDISTNNKNSVIMASVYFYNNNGIKTEGIFLLNNNMKILDEKLALEIDNAVNNNKYYKSIIHKTDTGIFIGFIQRDNNIFVVNIVDNKAGSGSFPIYYYEEEKIVLDKTGDYKNFITNLYEKAKIDCFHAEDASTQEICTNRFSLTALAYIEELYKQKLEKAEKYSYPEDVKEKINEVYTLFKEDYMDSCNYNNYQIEECKKAILSYENVFKY